MPTKEQLTQRREEYLMREVALAALRARGAKPWQLGQAREAWLEAENRLVAARDMGSYRQADGVRAFWP